MVRRCFPVGLQYLSGYSLGDVGETHRERGRGGGGERVGLDFVHTGLKLHGQRNPLAMCGALSKPRLYLQIVIAPFSQLLAKPLARDPEGGPPQVRPAGPAGIKAMGNPHSPLTRSPVGIKQARPPPTLEPTLLLAALVASPGRRWFRTLGLGHTLGLEVAVLLPLQSPHQSP